MPKPKPLTKWEQFRKDRGIKKTKRDRLVWDEHHEDWRPRYGKGRANNEESQWVIEHRGGMDTKVDPFTRMIQEKKERKAFNKRKQDTLRRRSSDGNKRSSHSRRADTFEQDGDEEGGFGRNGSVDNIVAH